MSIELPTDQQLAEGLRQWLPQQRWFSAKDRGITQVSIATRVPLLSDEGFAGEHLLVNVEFDSGPAVRYQIPLGFRSHLSEPLLSWALPESTTGAVAAYDGLHDPDLIARYLTALDSHEQIEGLRFQTTPGVTIDVEEVGHVLGAEQSNTSLVFGESLLFKVFRQVETGINPDVELHRALGEVGCEYVADLRGWVETDIDGEPTTLAMAQDFIENAADGWSMALISVRDLFTEADLHAAELGSDFAGDAERLGAAVAHVHADLARSLGTEQRAPGENAIDGMRSRLDVAAQAIRELAEHRAAIAAVYDEAAQSGPDTVQRIHGDLHLGQVLRTPSNWLLIDFEGEPIKPVAERRKPDSPLRDVAGMLRSFDYAGQHLLGQGAPNVTAQRAFRAVEWVDRNASAFCEGYASVTGADPRDQSALLRAYELDKAVYEAGYEARHRPSWLPLPLGAIARLTGSQ
ncbi:maltokinase [Williamsia limnetica]|uniref:Maltokinase n=1 Tax=Williamsia limnetica TaxID=882452 RepID=A0A318RN94_WILLI|nr:phosphotransferase [Williamsia limnetica]PYE16007.1 maltokinase [Williamsia limnetica]